MSSMNKPKERKMDLKKPLAVIIITISILTAACNIRITSTDEDAVKTAVAQTLMAQQSQATATQQMLPTITTLPTITPKPDQPTNTPQPCNKAAAVSETYPDDTEVTTGSDFDKSWRLQNIGTCTWNANYRVVFFSGDQMGGPNAQLLNTSVAPGEIIDIIIDQTAPASAGTYKGVWKLQDDSGSNFAQFWVQIKAVAGAAPALPPAVAALSLSQVSAEGGSVRTGGIVMNALYNVGDLNTNGGSQVFASFNISGIPAGSTITEVKVDFSDFDMLDDPFGDLGCLRAYVQDYGSMDAGDFFDGSPLGAIGRWCSSGELQTIAVDDDFKSALQNAVGDSRFQIRLQFNDKTSDNDNNGDMVRFGTIKLHVTYELP